MPSHKIHLAIANKVNESLDLDLDSVMLGSVLPDICIGNKHHISHFQFGGNDFDNLANPDKFVEKYKSRLDNPIFIGYLIHILTDRFYNEYFYKNYYMYDKDGNSIGIKIKNKEKRINKLERRRLKHREFFFYDKWLLNHKMVPAFKDYKCIDDVEDIEEAKFNKETLMNYIKEANKDINKINFFSKFKIYNYKITTQEELDDIFNKCIEYILDYINNNV